MKHYFYTETDLDHSEHKLQAVQQTFVDYRDSHKVNRKYNRFKV